MLALSITGYAYNVVDLPESMTVADAMGIFSADEITQVTISDVADGKYTDLTREEINDFYYNIQNMTAYRTINPTPFRGIAVNVYTDAGVKSYYLNSGIQIGLYGSGNYICYKVGEDDTDTLMYLDSIYKDADVKVSGEEIHRDTSYDFLKLPEAVWAQSFAKEAAANSLLPYEFTSRYSENITREQFCVLLGNMIAVKESYTSLESYAAYELGAYLRNVFDDCDGVDSAVDILYAMGIVNGRDDNNFDPYGTITREEAATLLCGVAEKYMWVGTETWLSYDDTSSISPWAVFYVTWANEYNIMTGITTSEFSPQGPYTVEQAVATVVRLYNLIQN
ncbi:MAG: S-layer homology domain-containing protein [Firmicutes bacterium]|nr:S-layer homology domain-containing protein [Bacillota bacterium]